MTESKSKHEHEQAHAVARAVNPTSATTSDVLPPGDPNNYVQAWVEAEEDSAPDATGTVHKVKVMRMGWKPKEEIHQILKQRRKDTRQLFPHELEEEQKEQEKQQAMQKETHKP